MQRETHKQKNKRQEMKSNFLGGEPCIHVPKHKQHGRLILPPLVALTKCHNLVFQNFRKLKNSYTIMCLGYETIEECLFACVSVCVCVCVHTHTPWHGMRIKVRRQLVGVSSVCLPCRLPESNSGH